jgi:hypothetical protein
MRDIEGEEMTEGEGWKHETYPPLNALQEMISDHSIMDKPKPKTSSTLGDACIMTY